MAVGFLNQISVFGRVYDLTSISDYYDTELDENSENAVQNKILTGEINGLKEEKANQTDLDLTNLSLQGTQGELDETKDSLSDLSDKVSKIIPIENNEIDNLFGS